jgi:hypothetical protein
MEVVRAPIYLPVIESAEKDDLENALGQLGKRSHFPFCLISRKLKEMRMIVFLRSSG